MNLHKQNRPQGIYVKNKRGMIVPRSTADTSASTTNKNQLILQTS